MPDIAKEELADFTVKELRAFIDTELQFVEQGHDLYSKLLAWDNMLPHLGHLIRERKTLDHLLHLICTKIIEIRGLVESYGIEDLRIEEEEERLLGELQINVQNKQWRLVRSDANIETAQEKKVLRLEGDEIKRIYDKLNELLRLIEKSEDMLEAIERDDFTSHRQKEDYIKLEEYYLMETYKFIRAYVKIFKDILDKEKLISDEVRKTTRRIR